MEYVFWWFLLAIPCFFVAYCNGADMNFRLNSPSYEEGFWKFYKNFFSDGFRLLVHDYFGVYCPWSWERAKRHRLADMRTYLGADGRCHDRLGHITAGDCDNPAKQEAMDWRRVQLSHRTNTRLVHHHRHRDSRRCRTGTTPYQQGCVTLTVSFSSRRTTYGYGAFLFYKSKNKEFAAKAVNFSIHF